MSEACDYTVYFKCFVYILSIFIIPASTERMQGITIHVHFNLHVSDKKLVR